MIVQAGANPQVQATLEAAKTAAAPFAFRYVGLVSIALIVVFGLWWLADKRAGGYKAVQLRQADAPEI